MAIGHDRRCSSEAEALVDKDAAFSNSSVISTHISAQGANSHPPGPADLNLRQKNVRVENMAVDSLLKTPENSPNCQQSDETLLSIPEIKYVGSQSKTSDAQYTGKVQGSSSKDERKAEKVSHVYSIKSLKEINQATKDTSVLVKVKPEAISENLFQYLGVRRERRHAVRARGLSNISTFSCSSDQSNIGDGGNFTRQRNYYQPLRQPYQPPPLSTSQRNDGFLRFLQQHASPPHHRVTAGGRIVPASPFSPPPMFDFASLSSMVHSDRIKAQGQGKYTDDKIHPTRSSSNMLSHAGANPTEVSYMQLPVPPNSIPYLAPLPNNPQAVNVMAPLGQLTDGTPLISYNGLCYRTFWSNENIVMEPLTLPFPKYHSEEEKSWSRPPQSYNSTFPSSSAVPLETNLPSTSGINLNLPRPNTPIASAQPADSAKEALLRQELADLNVYMALHHDVIEPDERLKLVEKRKHLVGRLDDIRASREPSTVKMPIIAPINVNRHAAVWAEPAAPPSKPNSTKVASNTSGASMWENKERGRTKKTLSPNAPSFVPSGFNLRNPAVYGFQSTQQVTAANLATPQGQEAANISTVHTPVPVPKTRVDEGSDEEEEQYSPPDPRDPAMRIIHLDDIKYAAKFENSNGAKLFCTTTEEFQEAVRQVREQARRHGCAGGSSKDPAYDAEQDIWWAICDHDPIPLPSAVPDYLARPRPWDWNDSAFNIRCMNPDSLRCLQVQQEAQDRDCPPNQSTGRDDNVVAEDNYSASTSFQSGDQTRANVSAYDAVPRFASKNSIAPSAENGTNESAAEKLDPGLKYSSLLPFGGKVQRHEPQKIDSAFVPKKAPSKDDTPKKAESSNSNCSQQAYVEDAPPSPTKSGHTSASTSETAGSTVPRCFAYHKDFYTTKKTDGMYKNDEAFAAEVLKVYDSLTPSSGQACRSNSEELTAGRGPPLDHSSRATSRTAWGPEEVSLATHDLCCPEASQNAQNSYLASAETTLSKPVVSLPSSHSRKPLYGRRFYPSINGKESMCPEPHIVHDANFVEVTTHRQEGQPDVNSPSFLQDMLKNPKYTYDFRHVDNTPMDPSTAWQIAKRQKEFRESVASFHTGKNDPANVNTDYGIPDTQTSNKENRVFSNKYPIRDQKEMGVNMLSPPASKLQSAFSPRTSASKSNSSLASSTYQARGYLPPYEGAGRAHTSTIYHQHGCGLQQYPRVNLPQRPAYTGTNELKFSDQDTGKKPKYETLSGHNAYGSFGLDGNAEAPSKPVAEVTKGESSVQNLAAFDKKGVTKADFDTRRPDPNNPAHHTAVDDFFKDLHKREVQKMEAMRRKNEKKGR